MAAHEHLNPTLFHGSKREFKPGDTIKPVTEENYREQGYSMPMPAFATENLNRARAFGHVYEVEPHDWRDVETEEDEGEGAEDGDYAYLSHNKGYKVIRKMEK